MNKIGRPIKNTDKLLKKYGPMIAVIYHREDGWEICCWHAGTRINVQGSTLPEALQNLEKETRRG
jgi:hypothetical protein